ncbi:hypothetical protein ACI2K4_13760 [Micromonospora sp. NPDC050397]|uniref:hypothetical protein n=1 Tax=Micromonospora sp. NPDC050397 TaxID=3364279 RepID=UPI00384DEA9A
MTGSGSDGAPRRRLAVGGADVVGGTDAAGKPNAVGTPDAVSETDAAGKPDAVSETDAAGTPDAVELLVDRDYPVALLLARVAVAADAEVDVPERAVVSAIRALRLDAYAEPELRPALLAAVLRELSGSGWLDRKPVGPPPSAGPFLPEDDRWAGWWQEDVVGWPEQAVPTVDQAVRALRRMPIQPRIVLVLRDAAGLSRDDAARVSGHSPQELSLLLESARDWLVGCLEPELGEAATWARPR